MAGFEHAMTDFEVFGQTTPSFGEERFGITRDRHWMRNIRRRSTSLHELVEGSVGNNLERTIVLGAPARALGTFVFGERHQHR